MIQSAKSLEPLFLVAIALILLFTVAAFIMIFFLRSKPLKVIFGSGALLGLGFLGIVLYWGFRSSGPAQEPIAIASLKSIAAAQEDFSQNDRDGNGVKDYWRADIAGLFALSGKDGPIRLIDLSVAAADENPKIDISKYSNPRPKAGYWFRALSFTGETSLSPNRFAICARPENPTDHRRTLVITNGGVIYARTGKVSDPATFPSDPLKEGWTKTD